MALYGAVVYIKVKSPNAGISTIVQRLALLHFHCVLIRKVNYREAQSTGKCGARFMTHCANHEQRTTWVPLA